MSNIYDEFYISFLKTLGVDKIHIHHSYKSLQETLNIIIKEKVRLLRLDYDNKRLTEKRINEVLKDKKNQYFYNHICGENRETPLSEITPFGGNEQIGKIRRIPNKGIEYKLDGSIKRKRGFNKKQVDAMLIFLGKLDSGKEESQIPKEAEQESDGKINIIQFKNILSEELDKSYLDFNKRLDYNLATKELKERVLLESKSRFSKRFNLIVNSHELDETLCVEISEYFKINYNWSQRVVIVSALTISITQHWQIEKVEFLVRLALLNNEDEYDYEILVLPGVTIQNGASAVASAISTVTNRGDAIAVVDTRNYGSTLNQTITSAGTQDSSYAATYWPWVQVLSNETGKLVWAPASTVIPGVYATNDRIGAEWFAPAGFNRGGVGGVIQAERKLSPADRDKLYLGKVNPIATFPGQGPVIFGQKTLQTAATSLDRVNVRRLLIELKRTIGNVAEGLLFEQNTAATRNRFLNQVNPYLESIQQRQGLYAYRVVMDDTNNTADVIDRNQMVGQIFIQPTRTAEYIILDFNVTPTGVEF